jgi:hypothetical protein
LVHNEARVLNIDSCILVNKGRSIGVITNVQMDVPIKVSKIWPKAPTWTPSKAPLARKNICADILAAMTTQTIPSGLASPKLRYETA